MFYLCERARDDRHYPKYPPIPVRVCPGYDARHPSGDGPEEMS